ncbi:GH39 family glycosyl hydrolase [Streptococcus parasuis]|uniref:Beta-xylosidase/AraC-like DNA-binding protein n=1 Tax=Streptococcus parasuis TaxID=1501662 RepID=A0ABV2ESC2_9STRE|nr:helix-turn-helix domain-containing protein [Streptococcus parasuis]BCP60468.1 hypothetical protein SUT286_17940 [Streptococcus parasuis]
MERDYLASEELLTIEFSQNSEDKLHQHENFELLYVLQGVAEVSVGEEHYKLSAKDFIIINYNRQHAYSLSDRGLVVRILISYSKMKQFINNDTILFWCNSTVEDSKRYDEVRQILNKILNYIIIDGMHESLSRTSLYYQLLDSLIKNFLLTADDVRYRVKNDSETDRMQEIFQYIRSNYRQTITLQDLADHFFLSTTYLSKYIKQECQVGFVEILNNVRLSHALVDLLHSDSSILKIALDNGFASVAAFNKVFKEIHNTTPSKFRKEKRSDVVNNRKEDSNQSELIKKVGNFLLDIDDKLDEAEATSSNVVIHPDALPHGKWSHSFTDLMNIGGAFDLTRADIQEQILIMKRELGVKYIRFWDIYSPRLHINIHSVEEGINFSRLDNAIDFLVKNDLIPFIELGFKPHRLMKTANLSLLEEERENQFASLKEMSQFFEAFIKHYVKRYGYDEVEKWCFEYWRKLNVKVENGEYVRDFHSDKLEDYFQEFATISCAIKSILPEAKVGGGGFPVQHYGKNGLRELLLKWRDEQSQPSFLSFTTYPYQIEQDQNTYYERRISNQHFINNFLNDVHRAIAEVKFLKVPIYVSEYGLTLSARNPINDHVLKGAFLVQSAFEASNRADLFGYYVGTDLYNEFTDSSSLLFGSSGVFSKTGIRKPSYFALEFLNQLFSDIIYHNNDCMITRNRTNEYRLLCHNLKDLSASYYLMDEDQITLDNLPYLFENNDNKDFHFTFSDISNGSYIIKSKFVNEDYGSIQNEWRNYYSVSDFKLDELDYFNRISTPRLDYTKVIVNDGQLDFNILLKPNEIRLIEIIKI